MTVSTHDISCIIASRMKDIQRLNAMILAKATHSGFVAESMEYLKTTRDWKENDLARFVQCVEAGSLEDYFRKGF